MLDGDAADGEDEINFLLREIIDGFVGGDAEFVEPARFFPRFENRDRVAMHG